MPAKNKLRDLSRDLRELARDPVIAIITAVLAAGLFLFIVYPILLVLVKSLFPEGNFSFSLFETFFRKKIHYRALLNSLALAGITTPATTALAFVFAFMVNRGPKRLRGFFRVNAVIPFVTPPFVFSLALIIIGGRQGLISRFFDIEFSLFGWPGVIIAQVLHFIPLCFIMIDNVLRSLNPNVEEAAYNMGAGQVKALFTIILPLCLPGLLKAGLLVFILSLADFGNPALIGRGISFLAVEAYLLVIGQYELRMASVYSVMLLVPSLVLYIIHRYVIHEDKYQTITGAPGAREEHWVAPIIQIPMLIVCFLTSAAILLIFVVIIAGAFTKIIGINHTLTLNHFSLTKSLFVLKNSVVVSFYSAIGGACAGTFLAYVLVRKPVPAKNVLELISLSGFAVPGTIIGIGFILAFNSPPIQLTGTMIIIVLSMISRTIAVSVEAGLAKLYQIGSTIEEASTNMGASSIYTFIKILLPLMFTAFFGGMIYSFIHAMNTLSAVIFITPPQFMLAPISIFQLAAEGRIGQACSLSLFLILSVFASLAILNVVTKKTGLRGLA
ncbi:MAG: iron ABC transporter permease [Deltaproteobacteria bacterium]|nr:iron ABC transporter permease [Deltaproteobacteria bacterium]